MSTLNRTPDPIPDTATDIELLQQLDLDLDGQLTAADSARLDEQVSVRADLGKERRRLGALRAALAESRVAVPATFREQVMTALPHAAWEKRSLPAWAWPAAVIATLSLAAAWVLGGAAPESTPIFGTGLTVVDFFRSTAMAGAGLLAASWQGLEHALEELLAESSWNLVAMVVLVVGVNAFFFNLLRRRRVASAKVEVEE